MLKHLRLVVVVSLIVVMAGCAQEPSDPYELAFDAIDQMVRVTMEEAGTPGLALGITTEDELLYERFYGYADLGHRTPVTGETLFQIGSISKSFTALALMHLMDEGLFDPQKPVQDYLPWWRVQTEFEPITGHHLLTHTAGIPSNRDDIPGGRYMAWAQRERAAAWPPGGEFHYSNVGYQTLGVLVEELSGELYGDVIWRLILEPLGMDHTNPSIELGSRTEQATGYIVAYDDRPSHRSYPLVEAPFLEYWMGDGSVQSTATDMATYMRMLMRRGQGPKSRIVSEDAFDLFATPHHGTSNEKRSVGYGYGMGTSTVDGHDFLEHSGGMVGLYANMEIDLTSGVGIVVLVNGPVRWKPIFDFAREALSAAEKGEDPPSFPESEDPTVVEDASDYAGDFVSESGSNFAFTANGDRLLLQYDDGEIVLEGSGKDSFFTPHTKFNRYVFSFGRDDDGAVVEVTHGGNWFTNGRYQGPKQFEIPAAWAAYTGRYRSYSPWFPCFEIFSRKDKLLAVIGTASETGSGEMVLQPLGSGTFHPGEKPTPEVLLFEDVVDGQALRASWSGHEFFKVSP